MDMYYFFKEILTCQDCKYPLTYNGSLGFMCYSAVCIGCGKEYEINLEVNPKRKNGV
jgi:hypothetical protein